MRNSAPCAILFACCLVSAPALGAEPTTPFKCVGPFGRDTNRDKLVATFGASNVTTDDDVSADYEVSIVFPNSATRQLMVTWNDEAKRSFSHVTIGRGGPSSWSVAGVAIGTPLVQLERLNGRPFKLNYFEGDYGGDITDWLGGRFDTPLPGGCTFGATVVINEQHLPDAINQALDREVTPDRSLLSSGAGLRAAKPIVGGMYVGFRK